MVKFKYKNQNIAFESINLFESNFVYGAYKCKSNDNKMILFINNYLKSFLCFLKFNLFDDNKKLSFFNIFFILFVYLLLPHKTDGLINRKYLYAIL